MDFFNSFITFFGGAWMKWTKRAVIVTLFKWLDANCKRLSQTGWSRRDDCNDNSKNKGGDDDGESRRCADANYDGLFRPDALRGLIGFLLLGQLTSSLPIARY